jgi:hypothetical protein
VHRTLKSFAVALVALLSALPAVRAEEPAPTKLEAASLGSTSPVHRFGRIWLAGQPGKADLALARDLGIGAVVNLRKPGERPLLLHCASANRVGAVWLAHRVLDGGLSYDAALREAELLPQQEADLSVDAVLRDLVVLDLGLEVLDVDRADALERLARPGDRRGGRILPALRRFGHDLDDLQNVGHGRLLSASYCLS